MPEQVFSDCHTHSHFSPDGVNTPAEMLDRAETMGFRYYTLTDHCECNTYVEDGYVSSVPGGYEEMCRLEREYRGPVTFLKGIELGQPHQAPETAQKVLEGRKYDFVIGSLHNLLHFPDFYYWDRNWKVDETLEKYFEELNAVVEWGRFDSLAHISYPLRYIEGDCGIPVDRAKYRGAVTQLLEKLIRKGIALELNTSGLRQKIGETLPRGEILSLYRSLGGELVTIGSDAHRTDDLGKGIREGIALLKECGFSSYTVFVKRRPVPIAIV